MVWAVESSGVMRRDFLCSLSRLRFDGFYMHVFVIEMWIWLCDETREGRGEEGMKLERNSVVLHAVVRKTRNIWKVTRRGQGENERPTHGKINQYEQINNPSL